MNFNISKNWHSSVLKNQQPLYHEQLETISLLIIKAYHCEKLPQKKIIMENGMLIKIGYLLSIFCTSSLIPNVIILRYLKAYSFMDLVLLYVLDS